MATFIHDPQAVLRYGFNWADWLGADTITTSTWTVTPQTVDDTSMTLSTSTHDTTTTAIKVTGGTVGKTYTVTNHVVTAAGDEDDRSHTLKCRNR